MRKREVDHQIRGEYSEVRGQDIQGRDERFQASVLEAELLSWSEWTHVSHLDW